jgi:hypothetical protein
MNVNGIEGMRNQNPPNDKVCNAFSGYRTVAADQGEQFTGSAINQMLFDLYA